MAIDFHQDKPGRIIGLLNNVKTGNATFANALARIGKASLFERFDILRFHSNMDMDN